MYGAIVTPLDSFRLAHETFFGETPKAKHLRLYESFPAKKGASDRSRDEETFEATLIMAIVQTYPRNQRPDPFTCYLFIPAIEEKWAVNKLGEIAKRMFGVLKAHKKVQVAKHLGRFFHAVLLGSRTLHLDQAPERWVAFGFDRDADPIPDWMRDGLLDKK